jgi:hypothetical protein
MLLVALLRYYVTKLMYQPDNLLLAPTQLSFKALKKTMYEKLADFSKEPPAEVDVYKLLEEQVKPDIKNK